MAKPRKKTKAFVRKYKKATILIPLTFNDGTSISLKTLEKIQDEIFVSFHGWTIEGVVKGAYRMQTGERKVESLQRISVYLASAEIEALEKMVAKWAELLGQEAMLLEVADFEVKFVPPKTGRS